MTSPAIFICYRSGDGARAGRLADGLRHNFGEESVFFAEDTAITTAGDDWQKAIDAAMATCRFVLVVIGPQWNPKRLHEPGDVVAYEMTRALQSNTRVIPVIVGGASLPKREELPKDIQSLLGKQAFRISDHRWNADYKELLRLLEPPAKPVPRPIPRQTVFVGLLILVAAIAVLVWTLPRKSPPVSAPAVSTAVESPVTLNVPPKVRALTGPLIGVDMAPSDVDWQHFDPKTIAFIYVAVTRSHAERFKPFWNALRQHNIRRGAFFEFRAGVDPIEQADRFTALLDSKPDDLPPVVNVENDTGLSKLTNSQIGTRLRACLNRIEARTGTRPMIYTFRDAWRADFGDFSMYPLWVARAGTYATPLPLPGTWQQLTIWQGDGGPMPHLGYVDLDYFNGGQDALNTFIVSSRVKH